MLWIVSQHNFSLHLMIWLLKLGCCRGEHLVDLLSTWLCRLCHTCLRQWRLTEKNCRTCTADCCKTLQLTQDFRKEAWSIWRINSCFFVENFRSMTRFCQSFTGAGKCYLNFQLPKGCMVLYAPPLALPPGVVHQILSWWSKSRQPTPSPHLV